MRAVAEEVFGVTLASDFFSTMMKFLEGDLEVTEWRLQLSLTSLLATSSLLSFTSTKMISTQGVVRFGHSRNV